MARHGQPWTEVQLRRSAAVVSGVGCSRVVINAHGEALSPRAAKSRKRIIPDIVFIREDGWSLGSPRDLEAIAFGLWEDEWAAFMGPKDRTAKPIEDYHRGGKE